LQVLHLAVKSSQLASLKAVLAYVLTLPVPAREAKKRAEAEERSASARLLREGEAARLAMGSHARGGHTAADEVDAGASRRPPSPALWGAPLLATASIAWQHKRS
jgi:hypothetical protein